MAGERSFGYCVVCGLYGAGVFDHVISPFSDAIRDHIGCPDTREARVPSRFPTEPRAGCPDTPRP